MSVSEPDEFELHDNMPERMERMNSERSRRGRREAAQRGFYTSSIAPYGYRKVTVMDSGKRHNKLEPDPQHADTVRRIFEARLQGATERGIAEQLNQEGILSATGQRWDAGKVRRILRNEVYCGTIVVGRRATGNAEAPVRVPNAFSAIISQDEFDQVQRMDE